MEVDPYQLAYNVLRCSWTKFGIPPEDIPPSKTEKVDSLDPIIPGLSTAVAFFQIASRKDLKTFLDSKFVTAKNLSDVYKRFRSIIKEVLPRNKVIANTPNKAMQDTMKEYQSKGIPNLEAALPEGTKKENIFSKDDIVRQDLLEDALKEGLIDVSPKEDLLAEAVKIDLLEDALMEDSIDVSPKEDLFVEAVKIDLLEDALMEDLIEDAPKEDLLVDAVNIDLLEDALEEDFLVGTGEKKLLEDQQREDFLEDAEKKVLLEDALKEDLIEDAPKEDLAADAVKTDLLEDALKENLPVDIEKEKLFEHSVKKDLLEGAQKEAFFEDTGKKNLLKNIEKEGYPGNFIYFKDIPDLMAYSLAICAELVLCEMQNEKNKEYMESMPKLWKEFFDKNLKQLCNKVRYTQDNLKDYSNSIKFHEEFLNEFISENKYECDIAAKFFDYIEKISAEKSVERIKFETKAGKLSKVINFQYMKKKVEALKEICECVEGEEAIDEMVHCPLVADQHLL